MDRITDIDLIRIKSKNLNGRLNGRIKWDLEKLRSLVSVLADRTEASDDPLLLKGQNRKLRAQIRDAKVREENLMEELERAIQRSQDLKEKIIEAERKIVKMQEETDRFMACQHYAVKDNNSPLLDAKIPWSGKKKRPSVGSPLFGRTPDAKTVERKENREDYILQKLDELTQLVKGGSNTNTNINTVNDVKLKDKKPTSKIDRETVQLDRKKNIQMVLNVRLDKRIIVREK